MADFDTITPAQHATAVYERHDLRNRISALMMPALGKAGLDGDAADEVVDRIVVCVNLRAYQMHDGLAASDGLVCATVIRILSARGQLNDQKLSLLPANWRQSAAASLFELLLTKQGFNGTLATTQAFLDNVWTQFTGDGATKSSRWRTNIEKRARDEGALVMQQTMMNAFVTNQASQLAAIQALAAPHQQAPAINVYVPAAQAPHAPAPPAAPAAVPAAAIAAAAPARPLAKAPPAKAAPKAPLGKAGPKLPAQKPPPPIMYMVKQPPPPAVAPPPPGGVPEPPGGALPQ